jgi:tRNA (guanine37-N1)-methyltransferase
VNLWPLRDFADNGYRRVDDRPFGGGPGMVMMAEPLQRALAAIRTARAENASPAPVVHFTPTGGRIDQTVVATFAASPGAILLCGRYEGIDQRVFDHFASRGRVRLVSLGDYVLNGGEVAVMAMIEAVGRLIPGMVGNPESLVEESHEDGLLEYPSYTKPSSWRGLDVPPVLLSGNHGAIATWRHDQQLERTRRVRPDLLPPANAEPAEGVHG